MTFMQIQAREMKSKRIAGVPFAFLLIVTVACVPSPAHTPPTLAALSATPYASLTPITPTPMPSSTNTPLPPTATATEIPDVREIRSIIHAYFDIRYSAFVAMVPLQPEDFSEVVSAHPDAAAFLNAELEKLAIQMKWYELTNLGLVSYEFFFTDEEILIDSSGLTAKVTLRENARYSRQSSPSTIAAMGYLRHEILLRKEKGDWKIISDQYTDAFWKVIRNSSRSPQEILRDLALPTPDDARLHARIHQLVEQNTPLECKIKNSEGRFFVSGDELFRSYLVVNSSTLDEKLEKNIPDWKEFSQSLTSSSAPVPLSVIIVDASIQKEYQISPIVTLVTLGESLNWDLPDDGDVATRAKNISKQLHNSFADWYLSESGEYQNEYPQIENAATYALYQFFQGDGEKLESWCASIQNLFLDTSTPGSPTETATLVQQPTPDMCSRSQWQDGIFILSDLQFGSLEIGRAAKVSYNRTLIEKNPAWEGFTQYDEDLQHMWEEAGDVFLGRPYIKIGEGVAPGVLLITYGIEYNWEPPENGDLIARVVYTRDLLWAYFASWWKGNVDKSLYPPIDNAATYALYRYFNGDMDKLERWCSTFVEVFKETPWD